MWKTRLIVACLLLTVSSCRKATVPTADFTTPEGAILCLEDAYRRSDIEASVACKDFWLEAQYMLESEFSEKFPGASQSEERVASQAKALETTYRNEMAVDGCPDFNDLRSTFPSKIKVRDDIYCVTEVCYFPDGGTSRQNILVGRRNGEWKVLNPLD